MALNAPADGIALDAAVSRPSAKDAFSLAFTLAVGGMKDSNESNPLDVSSEITNPLAALRGTTQLLGEKVTGQQAEMTKRMLSEIDRIKERVDGFLQVGPRANVDMHATNIHALIDDVTKGESSVKVQRSYDPSIPDIMIHETRMRQAIENLWTNAIEAGSDLIIWETRIAHGITLFDHKGAVVSVKITSNGQAIPEALRHKLFEPYVTDKTRGNGLGLSIVQQVVQEHGGKVMVHSEPMRTSFTLCLPLRTTSQNTNKQVGKA